MNARLQLADWREWSSFAEGLPTSGDGVFNDVRADPRTMFERQCEQNANQQSDNGRKRIKHRAGTTRLEGDAGCGEQGHIDQPIGFAGWSAKAAAWFGRSLLCAIYITLQHRKLISATSPEHPFSAHPTPLDLCLSPLLVDLCAYIYRIGNTSGLFCELVCSSRSCCLAGAILRVITAETIGELFQFHFERATSVRNA